MSRPKPRRTIRSVGGHDPRTARLRAELEARLDQLRATIEAKRHVGWTVVHCPAPFPDEPS